MNRVQRHLCRARGSRFSPTVDRFDAGDDGVHDDVRAGADRRLPVDGLLRGLGLCGDGQRRGDAVPDSAGRGGCGPVSEEADCPDRAVLDSACDRRDRGADRDGSDHGPVVVCLDAAERRDVCVDRSGSTVVGGGAGSAATGSQCGGAAADGDQHRPGVGADAGVDCGGGVQRQCGECLPGDLAGFPGGRSAQSHAAADDAQGCAAALASARAGGRLPLPAAQSATADSVGLLAGRGDLRLRDPDADAGHPRPGVLAIIRRGGVDQRDLRDLGAGDQSAAGGIWSAGVSPGRCCWAHRC